MITPKQYSNKYIKTIYQIGPLDNIAIKNIHFDRFH